jgi:hypothetical protein
MAPNMQLRYLSAGNPERAGTSPNETERDDVEAALIAL